jgi:tetratricopeptide (TPR) repeat protein
VSGDLKMNMNKVNINWRWLLLITCLAITAENTLASSSSAVDALLLDAKTYYEIQQFERSAALLERALRIEPNNPKLWYYLAGVRLEQKEWERAIHLAKKSNALAGDGRQYEVLRQKNERLIASAFHDLAEVRLEQKEWDRAIKLARKSLRLAGGSDKDSYKLRLKNWVVITQACESMADWKCARNARNNAQALAQALAR